MVIHTCKPIEIYLYKSSDFGSNINVRTLYQLQRDLKSYNWNSCGGYQCGNSVGLVLEVLSMEK